MALALSAAGCKVSGPLARGEDLSKAAEGADVLVLAVRDSEVGAVAAAIEPSEGCVVAHLSGSLGLDVLHPHPRRASIHPLAPLPSREVGARRLASGIYFAVEGDPAILALVELLHGRVLEVDPADRVGYHAAACIASNHLVALMGQVERVAKSAGLELEPFLRLAFYSLEDVASLGPAGALTGPASRGDLTTIESHRARIGKTEQPAYDALATEAMRLASGGDLLPAGEGIGQPAELQVIQEARTFSDVLEKARSQGLAIGLVPTMGALHEGHRSLIERSATECDLTAVTIFVNPLQFEDPSDLACYPRTLDEDLEVARKAGAEIVFVPPVEEMYPGWPAPVDTRVHVSSMSDVLEGSSRPGHLDGVATVVTKLFSLAGRCRAYFGEKDYQQLAMVRRMVADLSLPVEVVGCPTVREENGLALSSRNVRLSPQERVRALALRRALLAGRAAVLGGERNPAAVRALMAAVLDAEEGVERDYAEVVDAASLTTPEVLAGELRLLVAARVGPVRLIDNESVHAPALAVTAFAGQGAGRLSTASDEGTGQVARLLASAGL